MRTAILAVAGLAFGATACSSGGTTTVVERNPVAAVSVSLPSPSIVAGQTAQAVATPRDAGGAPLSDRPIVWQSSSSLIASVSDAGIISALASGAAVISATSEGVRGEASLTVMAAAPVPVANVSVTLSPSSLVVGQTANATATLRDAGGNDLTGRAVAWSSSNAGVASVNSSGVVTALSAGSTNIVATSEGQNGLAALTVSAPPPPAPVPVASVSVSPTAPSLTVGGTIQLSATTRDASGNVLTGRTVTWTSSNAGAASVNSSGLVTAVSAGSATISAFSEGQTGSSTVTVTAPAPVPVASVSVSPATANVAIGQTQQLTATVRDANNNILTGRTVTWASNGTAVATVSASGLVSAIASGSATITATSGGVGGTASITVPSAPPPGGGPTIFSDDFESGSLSKWDEFNSTTQQVINNSALAHSGNSFMRMTYGVNGGDGKWLNKYFTQGYTRLYVRLWVRFSTNFGGGTKLVSLRGSPIGNPQAGVGRAGICPNGRDSFSATMITELTGADAYPHKMYAYWQDMWADPNGQCWGRFGPTSSTWRSVYTTPMPMYTKGTWHLLEFTAKMNSSAGVADGEQKFWVDGVKYGEWKGVRWGDPAFVNFGILQINGSSSDYTAGATLDIDDLVLIYDYPTQ
jgi:uncharacterized protein YjdB